jgi:excisionase family DNA binding protein
MAEMVLNVKEAAKVLGVSASTVYLMVYRNEIPHRRVNAWGSKGQGKILIPREALEKWLLDAGS